MKDEVKMETKKFDELQISQPILRAIKEMGFEEATHNWTGSDRNRKNCILWYSASHEG